MSSPASAPSPAPAPSDSAYRLAPGVAVRLVGMAVALLALLLVVVTLLVSVADLSAAVLVAVAAVGVVAVLVLALTLSRWRAVRLGSDDYRIALPRLVRGVGVASARWREVAEAVTTITPAGLPVVVLRLVDERTTTIPVTLLATDREDFVRDLQLHLQHGQGLRPLA